jgi:hypothetical protein
MSRFADFWRLMFAASGAPMIAAIGLPLLGSAEAAATIDNSAATNIDQPQFAQQGPWLAQRTFDGETGLTEYSAITPAVEDHDFWLDVVCFSDGRLFLALSDTGAEAFAADNRDLSFRIQFEGGGSLAVNAKYVNGHMIAINPQTSRDLVVAVIHSQIARVSSLHVAQSDISLLHPSTIFTWPRQNFGGLCDRPAFRRCTCAVTPVIYDLRAAADPPGNPPRHTDLGRMFHARSCVLSALLSLAVVGLPSSASAGPPFITDDPEPVELGHWEVYGFSAGAFDRHDASGLGPSLEVNYGAAPNLQLHIITGLANDDPTGTSETHLQLAGRPDPSSRLSRRAPVNRELSYCRRSRGLSSCAARR